MSDIPPGCGTNRNERLHRKLRKIAGRNKLGVTLAYALFTRAFQRINEEIKQQASNVKEIETNIEENFGFFKNDDEDGFLDSSHSLSETNEHLGNSSIYKMITSRAEVANAIYNQATSDGFGELDNQEFQQSLLVFKTSNPDVNNSTCSNNELLDQRTKNMGLQRHSTEKDGDCFFTSLAFQLKNFMEKCDEHVIKHLLERGITSETTVKEIARLLRKLVVQEWLSNSGNYHHLVDPNVNYTTEVEQFLLPGHFATSIGDSMPLAAANALQIPIAIITSVQNMPFVIVTPELQSITSTPLFLAFTQEGAGHYDSLTQASILQNTQQSEQIKELHCRCGVNSKESSSINCCVVEKNKYWPKKEIFKSMQKLKAGVKCGEK